MVIPGWFLSSGPVRNLPWIAGCARAHGVPTHVNTSSAGCLKSTCDDSRPRLVRAAGCSDRTTTGHCTVTLAVSNQPSLTTEGMTGDDIPFYSDTAARVLT
jgi:hypothetical protein